MSYNCSLKQRVKSKKHDITSFNTLLQLESKIAFKVFISHNLYPIFYLFYLTVGKTKIKVAEFLFSRGV